MRALPAVCLLLMLGSCHIFAGYDDFSFDDRPPTGGVLQLSQGRITRIDVLLMIDNSRSMADKQQILEQAVPDLINALTNPACVDADGVKVLPQPAGPLDPCPPDSARISDPISDIHIGVISSSLGGKGADACAEPTEDDKAHLITRSAGDPVETYADLGFLAWDPFAQKDPPGEADRDDLVEAVRRLVVGTGETGCGYESQLESWYRFLVEPDPYESIAVGGDAMAELIGVDQVLLDQRRAFLRPDSLLTIIMLSDENDCSIRAGGQFYFAAQIFDDANNPYHLPKPRAACAIDPQDDCCRSCGQAPGPDCSDANDDCTGPLLPLQDDINLRCFDQKRRFGIDFLYPLDRYVTGLTAASVPDRFGNLQPNPLFIDLDPSDDIHSVRDPSLVYLTGIVGVPWQDIARQSEGGAPDLIAGLDATGVARGGFKNAEELAADGVWDLVLGDPERGVAALDALMIESVLPRSGENPITGDAVAPPGGALLENAINGHEYSIPDNNDLQYACIMPIGVPKDCSIPSGSCDCMEAPNDNPLCQDQSGAFGTIQYYAKAYPSLRQLAVLRDLGSQAIVGSICPAQQLNDQTPDFGYRPTIASLLEELEPKLDVRFCLDAALELSEGRVACEVIEATNTEQGTCDCTGEARFRLDDTYLDIVQEIGALGTSFNCFCGVDQADGSALTACRTNTDEPVVDPFGYIVHGWCYIDADDDPVHAPAFTKNCSPTSPRALRFVGGAQPNGDGALFLSCP